eukprot:4311668-Prymnesium_polylepis.1
MKLGRSRIWDHCAFGGRNERGTCKTDSNSFGLIAESCLSCIWASYPWTIMMSRLLVRRYVCTPSKPARALTCTKERNNCDDNIWGSPFRARINLKINQPGSYGYARFRRDPIPRPRPVRSLRAWSWTGPDAVCRDI